jgi:uracil-DNA glycosylase
LGYCAKHLREELRLFPHLETIVLMGEDAALQFQRLLLGRGAKEIRPFGDLLGEQGWSHEKVHITALSDQPLQILYCYHPTFGYQRSPTLAALLK